MVTRNGSLLSHSQVLRNLELIGSAFLSRGRTHNCYKETRERERGIEERRGERRDDVLRHATHLFTASFHPIRFWFRSSGRMRERKGEKYEISGTIFLLPQNPVGSKQFLFLPFTESLILARSSKHKNWEMQREARIKREKKLAHWKRDEILIINDSSYILILKGLSKLFEFNLKFNQLRKRLSKRDHEISVGIYSIYTIYSNWYTVRNLTRRFQFR